MKFILGRKVGMTRVFDEDGRCFAVTKVVALPCEISQIKDKDKDGYKAVQVSAFKGTGDKKKVVKSTEFKETSTKKYKVGDEVTLKQFKANETVTVEGTSKGKGFAGTIKRHSFSRGPVSHGSKNVRKPGSIGGGYPQRVLPGKRMAGNMGHLNVTIQNLRVIDVDDQHILIAGSIPGPAKSFIKIYGKGEKAEEIVDHAAEEEMLAQQKMLEEQKAEKEEVKEEPAVENSASTEENK